MLIGLCGGICAGKHSVADFLEEKHNFSRLFLSRTTTPRAEESATDTSVPREDVKHASQGRYQHSFTNIENLLDFVTKHWQKRWVTTDIWDEGILDELLKRPFFILVGVDAPVSLRWKRFKARCERDSLPAPGLEEFVTRNDDHLYDHSSGLACLINRAEIRLVNSSSTLQSLHDALDAIDLTNEQRLRPSWDQYFMRLASLAAKRSNCMKRRVGCVLVREKRVISTGYNGTPRGIRNCNEGGCPRCNGGQHAGHGLATCLCIHAEENALLEAGRERIREGAILYCDTIKITQVGITEVVFSQSYSMDTETAAVFSEGGVHLRQFSPPRNGLIDLANLPPSEDVPYRGPRSA
ncbi:MAG: Deoxycytidine monophosphate (dCMP) deaminase [Sclerophora amabilis]|nr:MAG: Deoxycytidine monophosphate (dCMP) deaminase [Sclerophora amabilis]